MPSSPCVYFFFSFYFPVLFFAAQQSFTFPREGRDFSLLFLYLSWSGDDARLRFSPPATAAIPYAFSRPNKSLTARSRNRVARALTRFAYEIRFSRFCTYTDRWEIIVLYLFSTPSLPNHPTHPYTRFSTSFSYMGTI